MPSLSIVGTETWKIAEIHDNEIFQPDLCYTVYRHDRIDKRGGGVIILENFKFTSVLRSEFNSNWENLWVQLNLAGTKSVLIGSNRKNNRKAMDRNWSNQKASPALKTKAGNK